MVEEAACRPGGTVLLIEDEEAIADLVRMYFEQDGFRLVHAGDGAAGLNAVRDRSPRVVLLDLGLPGMDGIEVCRRIRAFSDVPVIMLTARDTEVDKIVGLEIGADDYVTKPFSPANWWPGCGRCCAAPRRRRGPRPSSRWARGSSTGAGAR